MKKIVLMLMMAVAAISAHAQKYALIDMEYILKNVPAYERANEQLNQVSRKWQAEVEALNTEASTMYKNYQNEVVFLSQEQKSKRQDAIMKKEKEASDLKKKYFGPEGELFKKRESLMTPIQDEIYNTVKDISDTKGEALVIDRSSDTGIIFGSPKIDISNEVLEAVKGLSEKDRTAKLPGIYKTITDRATKGNHYEAQCREMYKALDAMYSKTAVINAICILNTSRLFRSVVNLISANTKIP